MKPKIAQDQLDLTPLFATEQEPNAKDFPEYNINTYNPPDWRDFSSKHSEIDPIQIERAATYIAGLFPKKPVKTTFLDVSEETNLELNKKYTIFKVMADNDIYYVTHDNTTNNFVLGTDQITLEHENYINSLPKPYQKMSKELRLNIFEKVGKLLIPCCIIIYEAPN